MSDKVNHPKHYCTGGIECIDALKSALGKEGFMDYCAGNCMKYLWRYKAKNGLEDLRKAQVYIGWLVEQASLK